MAHLFSPLRIVAAGVCSECLTSLGHQVQVARDGRHLIELCALLKPDAVVTHINLPELDGIIAATEICRAAPRPVVLIADAGDSSLMGRVESATGYILAILVEPLREDDLKAALAVATERFKQFQSLEKECADLRKALEDRKVIERAKGALMRRLQMDEEETLRRMRHMASKKNQKLVEVARQIVEAERVFSALANG